jgi:hypothetical protein
MSYLTKRNVDEIEASQHWSELLAGLVVLAFVVTILTSLL